MKRPSRSIILVALLVLALDAVPSSAADEILLIGNSFTQGLRTRLRSLARSAGKDVDVRTSAKNGYTLAHHVDSRSTQRRLTSGGWSHVVLQEQSDGIDVDRYPDARVLDAEADAAGARTVFFMTWADRDEPIERYDELRGVPGGDQGYVPIALELEAAVAPIGWAFREALLEDPSVELWSEDGHHASERGRYLAACVLFAAIYGESPVGLWPSPRLDPLLVLHDQQLAERVVLGEAASWNVPPAP